MIDILQGSITSRVILAGQRGIAHTETVSIGKFISRPGARPRDLGDAFSAVLPVDLQIDDHPRQGYKTVITYEWRPGDRIGVEAVAVTMTTPTVPDVTGDLLRELRIAEHSRDNIPGIVTRYGQNAIPSEERIAELVEAGPKSGHTLWLVQTVYRFAEIAGLPPAKFVQDTLGLKPATAGRWIRRSKEALNWGDRGDD